MNDGELILKDLISEVFTNKQDETLASLKKHKLDSCLINVLNVIQNSDIDSLSDSAFISSLSSTFLTNVNTIIGKIQDIEEKEKMEYIVSELTIQILVDFIKKSKRPPIDVINQISNGLELACKMNQWNFDELKRVIKFELLHTLSAQTSSLESQVKPIKKNDEKQPYYKWHCSEDDLEELSYCLKDQKIIKSKAEFKRLFQPQKGQNNVRFCAEYKDVIITLFDRLAAKKFISAVGVKAKKFTPLSYYATDFDKNKLFNSQLKSVNYGIKKNQTKAASALEKVDKWISGFQLKG